MLECVRHRPAVDDVFQTLGDATRRLLVERLSHGPRSVSELAEPLGITLAAVVQHVQVLERCGLARTEKIGRVRTCHLDPRGLDLLDEGVYRNQSELARGEGVSTAAVSIALKTLRG
jgi:DNA-binding transcriptional ArsR family regulator